MITGGVAIDLGCAWHGGPDSWDLMTEFEPARIFGFDPSPKLEARTFSHSGAEVILERTAAWTYDGWINFANHGLGGFVTEDPGYGQQVRCFDLASFVKSLGKVPIVLKMDVEGAEYPLLEHLIAKKATKNIWKAWVEWHDNAPGHELRKAAIQGAIDCEWAEWRW